MTLSRMFARPSLVALALILSSGAMAIAPPALAQKGQPQKQQGPGLSSKELVKALQEGLAALNAKDYATAKVKLDAAAGLAKTPQDKVELEKLRVPMASSTNDYANLAVYLQNALDTGLLPPDMVKSYKYGLVSAYANLKDNAKTTSSLKAYVDEYGGTADQYVAVGQELLKANDVAGVPYVEKAIAAGKAAGKPAESHYRLGLRAYTISKDKTKYLDTLDQLLTDYPKDDYWKDYVNQAQLEPGFQAAIKDVRIDIYRALYATGVKLTADQANNYATETVNRGLPGEAVAVLQPLSADLSAAAKADLSKASSLAKDDKAGIVKEEKDTLAKGSGEKIANLGEAFMTYGEYAKAVELMQAGIAKGIPDAGKADIARLHLGIAQYRAGQKDAAQATWASIKSDNGTAVLGRVWTMISKTKG